MGGRLVKLRPQMFGDERGGSKRTQGERREKESERE